MGKDFDCPDCDYYKIGMRDFNNVLAMISKNGLSYKGQDFNFCPWCGTKLERHHAEVQPDDPKATKIKRKAKK